MTISTPLISIPIGPGIVNSPVPVSILWDSGNFFNSFWAPIIPDFWEYKVNLWVWLEKFELENVKKLSVPTNDLDENILILLGESKTCI